MTETTTTPQQTIDGLLVEIDRQQQCLVVQGLDFNALTVVNETLTERQTAKDDRIVRLTNEANDHRSQADNLRNEWSAALGELNSLKTSITARLTKAVKNGEMNLEDARSIADDLGVPAPKS